MLGSGLLCSLSPGVGVEHTLLRRDWASVSFQKLQQIDHMLLAKVSACLSRADKVFFMYSVLKGQTPEAEQLSPKAVTGEGKGQNP